MTGNATKDWAEAHWAPLTGENTELTQFNIWHHRRFGFVDHRDATCGNRWVAWQASREALVVELPAENPLGTGPGDCGDGRPSFEQHCAAECNFILRDCREAIKAAGLKVKP